MKTRVLQRTSVSKRVEVTECIAATDGEILAVALDAAREDRSSIFDWAISEPYDDGARVVSLWTD